MEHAKTTKNIGQPCVICGQPANLQRALDAEREKLVEMTASQKRCWEQWTLAEQTVKEQAEQLATLQAQLADRDAMILQMGEQAAVLAKENMAAKDAGKAVSSG